MLSDERDTLLLGSFFFFLEIPKPNEAIRKHQTKTNQKAFNKMLDQYSLKPQISLNIGTHTHKERELLRNYFRKKETKEIWQLNAI